ncbi:MAG: murein L,D-transpeptidase catalytic domain family protein [Alphaproteobacteria bacterium]|nr:murein L,D-transpeptidase catalytic domain family protein [Alphaproteobacteria bacterium]MBV9371073.1 murein L,D-transpeptidase catalytic domain family protein [Alphaproteobacteria bacterium]MBV9901553.1 murein L,D-transpeptidase catalytic domain family protein [Alphaproteobacteria bacterium]
MTLTRRTFLTAAATAAAGATLPARAFAAVAPARPFINPMLKARALASLEAHRSLLRQVDVIGIADFNKASRDPRFYIVDLRSGFVTEHLVAHGRGSDPAHSGWLETFSNDMGSEATSEGAYLTGDAYTGKYGYSLRLSGLDMSNSNALARQIVVHSAWYAEPRMVEAFGKLGRSEGCFALPGVSHAEAMTRLGSGRFLYAEKL